MLLMPVSMAWEQILPKSDLIFMEFMKNAIGKGWILMWWVGYKNLYRLEIEPANVLSSRLLGKDQG